MIKISQEVEKMMIERFGKDTVIALATIDDGVPYVRYVNAYYENGSFYVVTYVLSNKMLHIGKNSAVAIAGEWFTAHGEGIDLGWWGKRENHLIAEKLKNVFAEWIGNGHTDFDDENTIILRIELTDGILFSNGVKYEL